MHLYGLVAAPFVAYLLASKAGIGYWWSLAIVPVVVGATGVVVERLMLSKLYKLDHLYGLLLTFGLALVIEGLFRNAYGSSGMPYRIPEVLQGATNLGFMYMPNYRGWVVLVAIVVCLATWVAIEKTPLGAKLRVKHDLQQQVAQFLRHLRVVARFDRIEQLAGGPTVRDIEDLPDDGRLLAPQHQHQQHQHGDAEQRAGENLGIKRGYFHCFSRPARMLPRHRGLRPGARRNICSQLFADRNRRLVNNARMPPLKDTWTSQRRTS